MNVLVIGKLWPEPNSSAAGKRMVQLIDLLQTIGTVTFACPAKKTGFEEQLSVATVEIHLNCDSFNELLKTLQPDIVVFDRFMIEEQFAWRVMEHCPKAIRILNTEDLHFLRNTRKEAVKSQQSLEELDFTNDATMRELASIYRCDLTLLTSDFELDLLVSSFGIPTELLIHLPVFYEGFQQSVLPFSDRKDLMFIGNFLHEPNLDAVIQLKTEVWPLVRKVRKDLSLHIYGAYANQQVNDFHQPKEGFIVHGRAENAKIVIEQARIMLAPLRFGAGIKGKLLEAMEVGTPSITTSIGSEGIAMKVDWPGQLAESPQEFADAILSMYDNEESWIHYQQKGAELLERKFRCEAYTGKFHAILKELTQNVEHRRSQHITAQIIQHQSLQASKYLSKWIMEKQQVK